MRVDSEFAQAAVAAVRQAAAATGVDFDQLLETACRESGLDQNARAKTSSAAGLFQFVEGTWLDMIGKFGAKYGVDAGASKKALLDLRFDPDIAAKMAGELTRENEASLARKIGRTPSAGDLYAAHVLGAEGAAKLIAAPGASAAALLPQAAAANRSIFYADGRPRTSAEVLAKLDLDAGGAPAIASGVPAILSAPLSGAGILAQSWSQNFGADLWRIALSAYRRDKPDEPDERTSESLR
jgi:hypothetical protein